MPSPWDTSYTYTTPGYANFGGGVTPQYGTAATVNRFMSGQAALPFQLNLPGYQSMIGQRSRNVGSLLRGELPNEAVDFQLRTMAERGVGTGQTGGPNLYAAWANALLKQQLGGMQLGSEMLSKSIADTPVPEIWNPMSLYVPERLAQQELAAARAGSSTAAPAWQAYRAPVQRWTSPSGAGAGAS